MGHYGDYQNAIYLAGLRGVLPKLPVDAATLEARAEAAMPPHVLNYVQGGCGDETTQRRNVAAFGHWGMVPRMLVDTSARDLGIELFGMTFPTPLFLSPIGVTGICTADGHGDLAAARASAALTSRPSAPRLTNSSHVPSLTRAVLSTGTRTMWRRSGSAARSRSATLSAPRNSPIATSNGVPVRARMSVASAAV